MRWVCVAGERPTPWGLRRQNRKSSDKTPVVLESNRGAANGRHLSIFGVLNMSLDYLVLDLDETLVTSSNTELQGEDLIELQIASQKVYSLVRPGARELIAHVAKRYQCTIWSTGQQPYVEAIAREIGAQDFDLWGRSFCKRLPEKLSSGERYEKPLNQITDNLQSIVLVDNLPSAYAKYPRNGIGCATWHGDPNDQQLWLLPEYLDWLNTLESVQRNHGAWVLEAIALRNAHRTHELGHPFASGGAF